MLSYCEFCKTDKCAEHYRRPSGWWVMSVVRQDAVQTPVYTNREAWNVTKNLSGQWLFFDCTPKGITRTGVSYELHGSTNYFVFAIANELSTYTRYCIENITKVIPNCNASRDFVIRQKHPMSKEPTVAISRKSFWSECAFSSGI